MFESSCAQVAIMSEGVVGWLLLASLIFFYCTCPPTIRKFRNLVLGLISVAMCLFVLLLVKPYLPQWFEILLDSFQAFFVLCFLLAETALLNSISIVTAISSVTMRKIQVLTICLYLVGPVVYTCVSVIQLTNGPSEVHVGFKILKQLFYCYALLYEVFQSLTILIRVNKFVSQRNRQPVMDLSRKNSRRMRFRLNVLLVYMLLVETLIVFPLAWKPHLIPGDCALPYSLCSLLSRDCVLNAQVFSLLHSISVGFLFQSLAWSVLPRRSIPPQYRTILISQHGLREAIPRYSSEESITLYRQELQIFSMHTESNVSGFQKTL